MMLQSYLKRTENLRNESVNTSVKHITQKKLNILDDEHDKKLKFLHKWAVTWWIQQWAWWESWYIVRLFSLIKMIVFNLSYH
jgi:hypothetical protein